VAQRQDRTAKRGTSDAQEGMCERGKTVSYFHRESCSTFSTVYRKKFVRNFSFKFPPQMRELDASCVKKDGTSTPFFSKKAKNLLFDRHLTPFCRLETRGTS
jgi:hypothetical protein